MRFTKAIQLMHRPQLITAQAAEVYARRIMEIDPRAFRRESRFAAVARKIGLGVDRSRAMEDAGEYVAPTRPEAYAPLWMGAPDKQLDWGWSIKDGIAMIEIAGPLVEKGGFVGECYEFMHGYDTIAAAIAEADADPSVKAMLIRFDTPGGVVASGIYDLSTSLQQRGAGAKPIWAHCEMACSAGYWIASQCDNVLAPSAGLVGSIGVVIVHENYAAALKSAGIEITSVEFPEGGLKTDGAWWKALSEEGKAALQSDINELGAAFLATVETGRAGKLTGEKAKSFGAQVFPATHSDKSRDATALGLIDGVMSEQAAFEALRAEVNATLPTPIPAPAGQLAARAAPKKPAASAVLTPETPMKTRAEKDAAIAAIVTDRASARTDKEKLEEIGKIVAEPSDDDTETDPSEDGVDVVEEDPADAAAAARAAKPAAKSAAVDPAVAQAVLALPEAVGREKLANRLAFKPGMTVEEAKADLLAAPKKSAFTDRVADPALSANGGDAPSQNQKDHAAAFANAGVPMRKRHR